MQTYATIVGNVMSDIDQVRTQDGTLRVSFRVATSGRRFDRAANTWIDCERFIAQVVCWRQHAENVLVSLSKGDPVAVTGRLVTREYVTEGRMQSRTYLDADAVAADLSRCRVVLTRTSRSAPPASNTEADPQGTAPSTRADGVVTDGGETHAAHGSA